MTSLTRTVTVAAGVFAAGHLGELTRYVPFDLVDAVLTETGRVQRRLRCLPSRVGVYFVLALGLFPGLGYLQVWDKLVAGFSGSSGSSGFSGFSGQGGVTPVRPSEKALRDLRRRVGAAPLRALFDVVAGPLAQPRTPGVRYRGLRTVAFDGCSSIKAPDVPRNRAWLGRIRHRQAWAGYPTVRVMALVETGTRGLLGACFGPAYGGPGTGEAGYARRLLHLLDDTMLLLTDCGFDGNDFLTAVAATRAQFLARFRADRRPPVRTPLPDGSYLSTFGTTMVRIIEATVTITYTRDSSGGTVPAPMTSTYRLATTLLDHRHHPAETLLRLYHERWEIESAFYALRHTILHGYVLRSTDAYGLEQELWALLTTYQLLRMAITEAAETRPGLDPDRLSFTIALEQARTQLTNAAGILPEPHQRLSAIGTALLAQPLPTRRNRLSVRKVKAPTSRYHQRPPNDNRPTTSTPYTTTSTITPRHHRPPPRTKPRPVNGLTNQPISFRDHCIALLNTQPTHHWHLRDIAAALPFRDYNSLKAQLAQWTRQGHLQRTSPGRYTTPQQPLTNPTKT